MKNIKKYQIIFDVEIDSKEELHVLNVKTKKIEPPVLEPGWRILNVSPSQIKYNCLTLGAKFAKEYSVMPSEEIHISVNGHLFKNKFHAHNKMLGRIDGLYVFYNTLNDCVSEKDKLMDISDCSESIWIYRYSKSKKEIIIMRKDVFEKGKAIYRLIEISKNIDSNNSELININHDNILNILSASGLSLGQDGKQVVNVDSFDAIPIYSNDNFIYTDWINNMNISSDDINKIIRYFNISMDEI